MFYDVSVIILTYNPIWEKLQRTLLSAINQCQISMEIIICDDGSKEPYTDKCQKFLDNLKFANYKFSNNKSNVGTVRNIINGINCAEGTYIYLISPGDYFYNEFCLSRIVNYARTNSADLVFGNAAVYSDYTDSVHLIGTNMNNPFNLNAFKPRTPNKFAYFLFCSNYIIGATILRSKSFCLTYFPKIKNCCKYIEDATSCANALIDEVPFFHFDDYIVWYELGTGISASANSKWITLLREDWENFYSMLFEEFKDKKNIVDVIRAKRMSGSERIKYLVQNNKKLLLCYLKQVFIMRFIPMKTNVKKIDTSFIDYLYGGRHTI